MSAPARMVEKASGSESWRSAKVPCREGHREPTTSPIPIINRRDRGDQAEPVAHGL